MAAYTPVSGNTRLTLDGAYQGRIDREDSVQLATEGMTVSLNQIENVRGSAGDDDVSMSGTVNGTGRVALGGGNDTLHLAAGSYQLDLRNVETVTGDAGTSLVLNHRAEFETDGSVSIEAARHGAGVHITYTDIVDDVTLSLGSGRNTVAFGSGFLFTTNIDGDLVAVRDGKTLTFAGHDTGHGSGDRLTIVVDGQEYTYAELVGSGLIDATAPTVTSVEASLAVIADAQAGAAGFSVAVTFDTPMQANGSADPVLTFDPAVASTLTLEGGSWNGAGTVYTATYTVADAGVSVSAVTIGVAGASDLATNEQQAYTAQVEFGIDTLNPTVSAFTEDNSDTTVSDADNVVNYSVTFSEAVSALTASDLDITGGSLTAGPSLAGNGLSATFSVTATDDSTADLVVNLKDTVVDANGNALVAPTAITLAVDTVNPTVTAFTDDNADGTVSDADNLVAYSVAFSKAVTALTATDLSISGGTLTTGPVLAGDGLSATFSVTATDDSSGNLVVNLKDTVVDAHGNALEVPTASTLALDTTNPGVDAVTRGTPTSLFTNADSLVYQVSFSESVSGVDATDFTVSGTTGTVTDVSAASGSVYNVTVSGGDLASYNGDVTLAFAGGQNITDTAGNALSSTTPTGTNDTTFKVDNVAPTVSVTFFDTATWGYQVFGNNVATLNGEGSDSFSVTASQIDWSKMWIDLDGDGSSVDITFSAADISDLDPTQGSFWVHLNQSKIDEINAAVDGGNDTFVIAEGFWVDLAGNVQLTGGGFITTAPDIV